jgi:hypothetical protein
MSKGQRYFIKNAGNPWRFSCSGEQAIPLCDVLAAGAMAGGTDPDSFEEEVIAGFASYIN